MSARPVAIGYLRRDISGVSQAWHETQIRSLAKRFGYELVKTVVFGAETGGPVDRLLDVVHDVEAEAVFTPGAEHFGGEVPGRLVRVCDVITVTPESTYARSLSAPFFEGDLKA